MTTHPTDDADGTVRAQLAVLLDRRPIVGSLRTEHGVEERFVGWLGFVGALENLRRLQERKERTDHD